MSSSNGFVDAPGLGCVVYHARDPVEIPELVRREIQALIEGLGVAAAELQVQTSERGAWRPFTWRSVEAACAKPTLESIWLLVGDSATVHASAQVWLRRKPRDPEFWPPGTSWFVADAARWQGARIAAVGRQWLELAAEHGAAISGGVLAGTSLRDAWVETRGIFAFGAGEVITPAQGLLQERLHGDDLRGTWSKIRRIYPLTLLGPRFASNHNAQLLRAAGALRVQELGGSLIVDASAEVVPAWAPAYLASTTALRRLAWPITLQNPADAEGLGLPTQLTVRPVALSPSPHVPDPAGLRVQVEKLLADERRELARLATAAPSLATDGALDQR